MWLWSQRKKFLIACIAHCVRVVVHAVTLEAIFLPHIKEVRAGLDRYDKPSKETDPAPFFIYVTFCDHIIPHVLGTQNCLD